MILSILLFYMNKNNTRTNSPCQIHHVMPVKTCNFKLMSRIWFFVNNALVGFFVYCYCHSWDVDVFDVKIIHIVFYILLFFVSKRCLMQLQFTVQLGDCVCQVWVCSVTWCSVYRHTAVHLCIDSKLHSVSTENKTQNARVVELCLCQIIHWKCKKVIKKKCLCQINIRLTVYL